MISQLPVLNQYFDKIYVITLKRATERQVKVKEYLEGVDFTFFEGIDKKDLTYQSVERDGLYDDKKAKGLNPFGYKSVELGHIACSLSHRTIYEDIVKNGYKNALIFEDDIIPNLDVLDSLKESLDNLPADFELIYLGYHKNEKKRFKDSVNTVFYLFLSKLGLYNATPNQIRNRFPKKYSSYFSVAGCHDTTHAYVVSNSGAKKLAALQTPVTFNADNLLAHAITEKEAVKAYITNEKFFVQDWQIGLQLSESYVWKTE